MAGASFHINPHIPASYWKRKPDVLLVAGAWGQPTNIVTTLIAKALKSSRLIFWSESHLKSSRKNWLINRLKTAALSIYDGFAVPGKLALEYVQNYAPKTAVYALPNTVDERLFKDNVLMLRATKAEIRHDLGVPPQSRVLLLSARLRPEKGIMPFLSALASLPLSVTQRISLLVAGDGPLREEIARWIVQHNALDVRLLGHVGQDEMIRLYAIADSLVLPSLSEPNPLSVIEAVWAGLPLLLSNRVGNWHETMKPGKNGWLFDPESQSDTCAALEAWANTSEHELKLFGLNSANLAAEQFATETVINNFLDQVLPQ